MKKIIVLLACILLGGCGKYTANDALKEMEKKISSLKSYHLTGELSIYRGEDSYTYDVEVSYQKTDFYRVSLINKINNHEQIILRNKEGVYVLTPSLNKSFKFQSEWPYNNSQIYLLGVILSDIVKDSDKILEKTEDGYIFISKVNYSNNNRLIRQKVYLDKDLNINKIEIVNDKDIVEMCMTIDSIEENKSFKEEYFSLENNMEAVNTETTMKVIEDAVYPMYIPVNTYLKSQDKMPTKNGERVILTFDGESPFMLVQETINVSKLLETNMVYGEPQLIGDTIGAITDYSISWFSQGIEYYLVSESMDLLEMLNVAQSITVPVFAK